jgi:hypothetical protein
MVQLAKSFGSSAVSNDAESTETKVHLNILKHILASLDKEQSVGRVIIFA